MPVGVMQWFDEQSGEGRVVQHGRVYPTSLADRVETHARAPGARVHFDVTRHDGIERAANVSAQPGTRTSHRHRRYGDQAGAHDMASNAPGKTERFTDLGIDRERRPRRVVLELVRRLADGELATARPLFAPDVVLHPAAEDVGDNSDVRGSAAVFDKLAESPLSDSGALPVNLYLLDDEATIDWIVDGRFLRSLMRVARGQITEIWWDVSRSASVALPEREEDMPEIQTIVAGPVKPRTIEYGRDKVAAVLRTAPAPVLFARLKLTQHMDPASTEPAAAAATMDLNGQLLRASAGAATMPEAIDQLDSRLRDRLSHLRHTGGGERALQSHTRKARALRRKPADRQGFRRLSPEDRQIVRHKTIADDAMTIDEALSDLQQLDYDFYLFPDLETGQDAVLAMNADGDCELFFIDPSAAADIAAREDVKVSPITAPRLDALSAKEWLDSTDQPMLFYADAESARGRVLYRRIDGDYGLLTV